MTRCRERNQSVPILLYIPVLHRGYIEFFERYSGSANVLWIIGEDLAAQFSKMHTEIRAMKPLLIQKMLAAVGVRNSTILTHHNIRSFFAEEIITANEEVSKQILSKYFPKARPIIDSVFLRYDEASVKSSEPANFDRLSHNSFDKKMIALAAKEAEKSSDWWRHIGAILVKNRKIIAKALNHPVPSDHMPYVFGNPRDFIEAGKLSNFSDVLHAEQSVFAKALHKGTSTKNASIYVTVFPCPSCAKLIAYSGVKKCFFSFGHASLDGERVLRAKKVEIIYVPT